MRIPSALTLNYVLSSMLILLVFISIVISTSTPKARIYTQLAHVQLSYWLFAIGVFYCCYTKTFKATPILVGIGIYAILIGASTSSAITNEWKTCIDVSSDQLDKLIACRKPLDSSGNIMAGSCTLVVNANLAECVVGGIRKSSDINLAKAEGIGASVIAAFELVLVFALEFMLTSHFWAHALVLIKAEARILLSNGRKIAQEWKDSSRFTDAFDAHEELHSIKASS